MSKRWWQFWKSEDKPVPVAEPTPKRTGFNMKTLRKVVNKTYLYPIQPPTLAPGVLPKAITTPLVAQDSAAYSYAESSYGGYMSGFPGYPYLAMLATRAEYRAFAASLSTEITREWVVLHSTDTKDKGTAKKVTELTKALEDHGIKRLFQKAGEHDVYYGVGQIYINLKGKEGSLPLILDPRAVPKGSEVSFNTVEPMWTTPSAYNAIDPTAPDFYKPTMWYVMGAQKHGTRLLRIVTRELPDMLKPAYNFSGISLSQLAEYYVDEWLRTKTSISNLINNFSITALKSKLGDLLQTCGDEAMDAQNANSVFARADLFTATRANQGLMLLDKDTEELEQINTPLSGLDQLQAQAQEHLCAVSRMPAIVLTGISPGGLNASSDSEIRVFYDWISALQESFYRVPLETILKVLQLVMYGEIDDRIGFTFQPLYQMTPKELSEIRKSDADSAAVYIDRGVIEASEERERIARDPQSGYQGLELGEVTNEDEEA